MTSRWRASWIARRVNHFERRLTTARRFGHPRTTLVGTPTNGPHVVDSFATLHPNETIRTLRRGTTLSNLQPLRVAHEGSFVMVKAVPAAAALAVAAALVVPTVSHAQDTRSITVSYADLNLTSGIGQDRLQRRVDLAASYVCGQADTRDFDWAREVRLCRTAAIDGAEPAVLAAINNARHPSVEVLQATALVVTAK